MVYLIYPIHARIQVLLVEIIIMTTFTPLHKLSPISISYNSILLRVHVFANINGLMTFDSSIINPCVKYIYSYTITNTDTYHRGTKF